MNERNREKEIDGERDYHDGVCDVAAKTVALERLIGGGKEISRRGGVQEFRF